MLRTGLPTLVSLALFSIAGCQGNLGQFSNFFFPSTFFAEYNFLTFIFEIAPTTSIAASLLLYTFLRLFRSAGQEIDFKVSH